MKLTTSGWISLLALGFTAGSSLLNNLHGASAEFYELDKRVQILQIQVDRLDKASEF